MKSSLIAKRSRADIIERTFSRKLDLLVKNQDQLMNDTADLTERMIHFASSIKELEEEAIRLDKAGKTKVHQEEIEKKISVKGVVSSALRSRWNTIASQAPTLLKYHTSLPATRDALYATARAIKENENISAWVKSKQLTPLSTVKDINNLRSKVKKKKSKRKQTISVSKKRKLGKGIPLGISISDLPTNDVRSAFHNDLTLLVVKREVDPDTSRSTLVAIDLINDPSILDGY
jgi:hypothetical protein